MNTHPRYSLLYPPGLRIFYPDRHTLQLTCWCLLIWLLPVHLAGQERLYEGVPEAPPPRANLSASHPSNRSVDFSQATEPVNQIEVPHQDKILSFEFATLPLANPERHRYNYRLDGRHEQWVYLGTERNVTFTHLDPGAYLLRVTACTADGVWAEEELQIALVVQPPWYRSNLAYVLFGLLLFGILYLRDVKWFSFGQYIPYLKWFGTDPAGRQYSPARSTPEAKPLHRWYGFYGFQLPRKSEDAENRRLREFDEDAFIRKVRAIVEAHLTDHQFNVSALSRELGISTSQLYRKITTLNGLSPNRFIRRMRLQKARELLLQSSRNISEIAYDSGFTSPAYFSRTFQDMFGMSPTAFRAGGGKYYVTGE